MADSITSGGLWFPPTFDDAAVTQQITLTSYAVPATAGSGIAFIGRVFISDRSASKLLSSAGGAIIWKTGTPQSVTATTNQTAIGIQNLNAASGPPGKPDGTFTVSTTITGSSAQYGNNTWKTSAMTSGAQTLSHGALYAVVISRPVASGILRVAAPLRVAAIARHSSAFVVTISVTTIASTVVDSAPDVLLQCDDGTLAWLSGSMPISSVSSVTMASADATNEYGMRFALPWTCQIDELKTRIIASTGSAADHTVVLYSDPKGTPVTVTSFPVLGDQMPWTGMSDETFPLLAPITLTASTTYLLSVLSTGNTISIQNLEFGTAAQKIAMSGYGGLATGARGGGTGAFSMLETNVLAGWGVRINQIASGGGTTVTVTTTTTITTTVGGTGGMLVHPGLTGGIRG